MASDQKDERTPAQKFEAYNPYADRVTEYYSESIDSDEQALVASNLAVAFALDRIRSEIHFGLKGRA